MELMLMKILSNLWGLFVLSLLFILILIFVRASIEVGEERLWLLLYLFIVPPVMALVVWWGVDCCKWPVRLVLSALALVIVGFLLVQTPLFADKIYENPGKFCSILPTIAQAEKLYLKVFSVDPDRYRRHNEKTQRWENMRHKGECKQAT
jgi:hypothetical protein